MDRQDCLALDAADPLAGCRDAFALPAGVVYVDGMSLGALPRAASEHIRRVVDEEWGRGLIRSWNEAGWIDAPSRIGTKLAALIGAGPGEVLVADSTSVNLFKLLAAAIKLRPGRPVILTGRGDFPTNTHIARGVSRLFGVELKLAAADDVSKAVDERTAVVAISHVDFKSARMHDMASLTRRAQEAGAIMLWDLSHSAGAMPVELSACNVDLAVGCGYKYLNGGPGAPSFLFVARRHLAWLDQPITGWMGHARPFDFDVEYVPAGGITRALSGTPPLLALAALEAALDVWADVDLHQVRKKSVAMSELFIRLIERDGGGFGLELESPRHADCRGSHVSLRHPHAFAVMQALVDRGVIGDFREPDIMRFGFAPLYLRYEDVRTAAATLVDVLATRGWGDTRYQQRAAVT